jgi:hypothetical protein
MFNMSDPNKIIYRVFDHKNNYTQSYSNQIENGFKFAKDCAIRMNGHVEEVKTLNGLETSTAVFTSTPKK